MKFAIFSMLRCTVSGILASLVLVQSAFAAGTDEPGPNWQPTPRFELVFQSYDGSYAYVDKESIVRDGAMVTYWGFYHQIRNRQTPVRLSMIAQTVDCTKKKFLWLESSYIFPNGRKVYYRQHKDEPWHYVMPGTDGDAEMRFVCQ